MVCGVSEEVSLEMLLIKPGPQHPMIGSDP